MSRIYILGLFALLFTVKYINAQTTFTFTTCGATGRLGPTQTQVNASYTSNNALYNKVTINTQGIQEWAVPFSGTYIIEVAGAGGGDANQFGGRGRKIKGEVYLTSGTVLKIVIGQKGRNKGCDWAGYDGGIVHSSGGGGGSFVVASAGNTPILIAAGGAGFHLLNLTSNFSMSDGSYNTSGNNSFDGTGIGGSSGNGGTGSNNGWGAGGGGFYTDGTPGVWDEAWGFNGKGYSFLNGAMGGYSVNNGDPNYYGGWNAEGGFGGGGGAHGCTGGGGGGGGFSGGGGSNQDIHQNTGGGGGSYIAANVSNASNEGLNYNDGYVVITLSSLTLTTSSLSSNSFCQGSNVSVPFIITGTFNSGNIFTAQLSNASGSFASPTPIGSISSAISGAISAIIPSNTPTGTGYRIRVVSSDPEVLGSDNGSDISINSLPTGSISGTTPICPSGSANLTLSVTGTGTINGTLSDGTSFSGIAPTIVVPVSPSSNTTYTIATLSDANCSAISSGLTGSATVTLNAPPVLTNSNYSATAGDNCNASVAFNATATGNPAPSITYAIGGSPITSPYTFSNGTTTVTATATNVCGTDVETFTVTVTDNTAPTIATNGNKSVNNDAGKCGAAVSATATASDNCSVGAPTGTRSDGKPLTDDYPVGTTTITWDVTDANGNPATAVTQTVTVTDNTKPVITHNGNKSVNNDAAKCGAAVTVSASASDNCSVGNPTGVRSDGLALTADYPVGTTTITWNVTDANGNPATQVMQTVTVTNSNPTLGVINAPVVPVPLGTTISIEVPYNDNNVSSSVIDWGDQTTSAGVITPTSSLEGKVTGSRKYATTGVYTIQVTLNDACINAATNKSVAATAVYQYVVVYDPNGGFITGGGWINSPEGAYAADPTLVGKANFGFVSKYQKGSTVPTGNTQFEFHAGNLNFKSTSYEWLVISVFKGQFKGKGTINGVGDYGFLLSAVDGQINGGGGVDKFRIKIWDRTTDVVVYDNQLNTADDAEASTPLGGGSIVIHTASKGNVTTTAGAGIIEDGVFTGKLTIAAMPNPSTGIFTLKAQSGSTLSMQVKVLDVLGRVVETRRNISANSTLTFGNSYRPGVYYVEVLQGTEKQILKLVKQ